MLRPLYAPSRNLHGEQIYYFDLALYWLLNIGPEAPIIITTPRLIIHLLVQGLYHPANLARFNVVDPTGNLGLLEDQWMPLYKFYLFLDSLVEV